MPVLYGATGFRRLLGSYSHLPRPLAGLFSSGVSQSAQSRPMAAPGRAMAGRKAGASCRVRTLTGMP